MVGWLVEVKRTGTRLYNISVKIEEKSEIKKELVDKCAYDRK